MTKTSDKIKNKRAYITNIISTLELPSIEIYIEIRERQRTKRHTNMERYYSCLSICLLLVLVTPIAHGATPVPHLKSVQLCNQCSKCDSSKCPPSESYPHMTAFDDTLIAGALQSDYVDLHDKGVYSVPDVKGGQSTKYNAYFGWKSTSGSASGYHRYAHPTLICYVSAIEEK